MKRFHHNIISIAFILLLIILSSSFTLAQEEQKGIFRNILIVFMPPTPEQEQVIAERLELTEEQRTQMKQLSDRYREDATTLRNKYISVYNDIVTLMEQTEPNRTVVNEKLKAFHNVHQEVLSREIIYWMDFKTILTPEQNKKFWNIFEQSRIRG